MKQTFKRLQALALVLAMCVSFLQIPSFAADDDTHGGVYNVSKVSINNDGTYTITEYCENHVKGNVCNTANGAIATKVADGKTVKDEANWKVATLKNTQNTVEQDFAVTDATCVNAGSIEYTVTVAGVTYNKVVTTDKATGNHTAVTTDDQKLTYTELDKSANWQLVEGSDTATCKAAGKATFAKKCDDCGKFVNTVEVTSPKSYHKFIQNEKKENQVFEEEITATSCAKAGTAYHYIQCKDCGLKLYANIDDEEFKETATLYAKEFPIEALSHAYEYTAKYRYNYVEVSDSGKEKAEWFVVTRKCANCKDEGEVAVKSVKCVNTVEPAFACQPGTKTYELTYEVEAPTAENAQATKEVKAEVTVPYYVSTAAYKAGHTWSENTTTDKDTYAQATCTKDGHLDQVYTCTVCGEKKIAHTVTTPATGKHTAADAVKENVVAATYAKAGSYDLVTRCADCGEVITSAHKTVAKLTVNKSSVSKVQNVKTKKAKVTIKKASSVTGYQIQYSTNKNFKSGNKSVKTKKTSYTIKNLKKGKKYYVRVRSYKTVDGKTYYSSWSGSKTVTIKK